MAHSPQQPVVQAVAHARAVDCGARRARVCRLLAGESYEQRVARAQPAEQRRRGADPRAHPSTFEKARLQKTSGRHETERVEPVQPDVVLPVLLPAARPGSHPRGRAPVGGERVKVRSLERHLASSLVRNHCERRAEAQHLVRRVPVLHIVEVPEHRPVPEEHPVPAAFTGMKEMALTPAHHCEPISAMRSLR